MKETNNTSRPSLLDSARKFFHVGRPTEAVKSTPTPTPKAKASRKHLDVLLVDDDPLFLKVTAARLDAEGYDVVTAVDGSEAIHALRVKTPNVVVLDVNLPSDVSGVPWSGPSLIAWMHRYDPYKDIPVVMVSGGDATKYCRLSLSAGARDFFHKQMDSHVLLDMVDQAVARNDFNSDHDPSFQI